MRSLKAYSPYYTDAPRCPVCLEECRRTYFNAVHEIIGCENCIYSLDARYIKQCKGDVKYAEE